MKFLIILAFKNLCRYKKRTVLTSFSIAAGLSFYIILDSMIIGSILDSTFNLKRYETGSGVIQSEKYWKEKDYFPLEYSLENIQHITETLDRMKIKYAPRINFSSDLIVYRDPYPEDGNIPVLITAVDPEKDSSVFDIKKSVIKGRFPEKDEEGIAIGQWLAEDIGADIGYPLTVITRTKSGYYQVIDLTITGIIGTENPFINRDGLFINADIADYHLEMDGAVTGIYLDLSGLKNRAARTAVEAELKKSLEIYGAGYYTWQEMAPDFVAASDMDRQGSSIMIFVIFIIAAVGISNTMLMAIFERTKEIGMMRAVGVSDSSVKWLFRIEAAGLGLIGSTAGLITGAVINYFLVKYGIDYSGLMREGNFGYRVIGIIRGVWSCHSFAWAFISGILFSFFVSFFPTGKAVKMSIPSCLKDSG